MKTKVKAVVDKNLVRINKDEVLDAETIRLASDILRSGFLKLERTFVVPLDKPDEEGHIYECAPGFPSIHQAVLESESTQKERIFYYITRK